MRINHIDEAKAVLRKEGIDPQDCCMVGSCSLCYNDIRPNRDIDLIVSEELRKKYGKGITKLSDNVEIVTYKRFGRLDDEDIIYNPKYHATMESLKVVRV